MTQQQIFKNAKWIGTKLWPNSPLIRKSFEWKKGKKASLNIIGLGTFECFINGKRVGDDYFLPLTSKFDRSNLPKGEELYGYRIYVKEYDLTELLDDGKNTIAVLLGEGLYTELRYDGIHRILGKKKLIFRISGEGEDVVSDGSEKYIPSFITRSGFHEGGEHDYTNWSDEVMLPRLDDGEWDTVTVEEPLIDTEFCYTDCPVDKIIRTVKPECVYSCDDYKIFDAGRITTGYPTVISEEGFIGEVKITFSELLDKDGINLDESHVFMQHLYATVDGRKTEIYPHFSWFGFRYFRIEGNADCSEVKVIHADISQTSDFSSSCEILNWIYTAYVHTQLTNIHRGGPSDCPHIEREFYTGDGQLLCKTAMMTLGAKELYKKWIIDISDCQDKISGRVQYTAPYFINCGGGPGGWSSAIITVAYEYYKAYGDDSLIRKLYPQMKEYLRFLEEHSDCGLVTEFKEGEWCLGDWAGTKKWMLPAPFVNTCLRITVTKRMIEIAKLLGHYEDVTNFENDIEKCKTAIDKFYRNAFHADDCYCANVQGAGAFAIAADLGTEITKRKLVEYYRDTGYFDTGIFGTELVTRVLFELGESELAYKLLIASEPHGYGKWYKSGATSMHEYFSEPSRSHSHPMFGAVVASIFEYIVGIRQTAESAGYDEIIISPARISALTSICAHITTPHGKIGVSYEDRDSVRHYRIDIPDGVRAHIDIDGLPNSTVGEGIHQFEVKL